MSIHDLISRRTALRGLASLPVVSGLLSSRIAEARAAPRGISAEHAVADGHTVRVLLRWGDPVVPGAPEFSVADLSAETQSRWFGTNCDFLALIPDGDGFLLFVNHEYTDHELMWSGPRVGADHAAIEMAAHGMSIVRIVRADSGWESRSDPRNRRITAHTPIRLSGPVAGHDRARTSADPDGRTVLGTLHNCSGGKTPWGTVLSGEENIYHYFRADPEGPPEAERLNRETFPLRDGTRWEWWRYDPRFDAAREPNEANRFGYVVEVDPMDPESVPVKRTALGRICHEGAACTPTADGRVAVYMGDDSSFQHLYRFVSAGGSGPDVLDEGVLYAAAFDEDRVRWLPLVHGQGPLTAKNDFHDQAGVLIETRRAAKLLGATELDRPERVEVDPKTQDVYVVCTSNRHREEPNAASPRAPNLHGHVLRIAGGSHAELENAWTVHVLGGDGTEPNRVQCPDNCAIDPFGRLWLCTDGASNAGVVSEGVHLVNGATTWRLFSAPIGAEVTGPCFSADGRSLFVSIQHPADGSTFDEPSTRWPDFDDSLPPRASVIVIEREDGGVLGP